MRLRTHLTTLGEHNFQQGCHVVSLKSRQKILIPCATYRLLNNATMVVSSLLAAESLDIVMKVTMRSKILQGAMMGSSLISLEPHILRIL